MPRLRCITIQKISHDSLLGKILPVYCCAHCCKPHYANVILDRQEDTHASQHVYSQSAALRTPALLQKFLQDQICHRLAARFVAVEEETEVVLFET